MSASLKAKAAMTRGPRTGPHGFRCLAPKSTGLINPGYDSIFLHYSRLKRQTLNNLVEKIITLTI